MPGFLTIPRELRDQIGHGFFTSPTGYLSFQHIPLSSPQTLKLFVTSPFTPSSDAVVRSFDYDPPFALLRTCKQLYFECAPLLWCYNNMLACPWSLIKQISTLPLAQQFRTGHVTLKVDLLSVEVWDAATICSLGKWAQGGCLKSLNMHLVDSDDMGLPGMKWRIAWRTAVREHLQIFERLGEDSAFRGVEKNIRLDSKAEKCVKGALEKVGSFEMVIGGLKSAMGCEMWIDGAFWDKEAVGCDVIYQFLRGSEKILEWLEAEL
ncbi:hypothetical protein PZA11_003989 [Diplocarpon coronariae]|uniref:Uncharacterized protein n=1 Tax=Diplocarpon coronariae TaxID=2795749 RepID=A0A218Z1Y6_9HELO|nr:hypothetical protein B2J93_2344 [Marssonina coronariae]